jgi:hypothetical protein
MLKSRIVVAALLVLAFALPSSAMTYKSTYPVPCSEVWGAVKDTLGDAEHYTIKENDDAKMSASYDVKHEVHVNVTGAILQRTNKVKLVPKGSGCELQVVSNFSGWEHNDRDDFKKRVDEALVNRKTEKPEEKEKPAEPAK